MIVGGVPMLFGDAPAGDPNFANVSLLLHFDGVNNATTATDSSNLAHVVTFAGDAKISTAQSMFGNSSLLLDGVNDYVSLPHHASLELVGVSFTIEAFVRIPSYTAYHQRVYSKRSEHSPSSSRGFECGIDPTGRLFMNNIGTGGNTIYTTNTVPLNTQVMVAYTVSGTTARMFIAGVKGAEATLGGGLSNTTAALIGISNDLSSDFNGYIDELRITKDVARYTANFTPPTAAFPDF